VKPSQLKKDSRVSARINAEVKSVLDDLGISIQDIIDAYIDNVLKVDVTVGPKYGQRKPETKNSK
jgi:hypothetical protein